MHLVLKKGSYLFFMLFFISLISFFAIHFAPNSFFGAGELNPNMTPEAIAKLKAVYGLDKPLLFQYKEWILHIFTFNFGVSFVSGKDVTNVILQALPITLFLNIISLISIFLLSLFLGIKSALHFEKKQDYVIRQVALFSFALPSFYLALIFILLFSVHFEIFPIAGVHSLETKIGLLYYLDMFWHLTLPLFVMIFGGIGSMIIYIRSLTLEILKSDYYYFAKSRGLSSKILLRRYILPNLLPPIVTLLGLSLPGLIGGSVILESIFGIEGMGQLFYLSAMSRDYPVIMGILIIGTFLTLVGNMLTDILLLKLNPYAKNG